VRKQPARLLASSCPVPQAIASSFILAREVTFRNKIPAARVLRRPELITVFGDGRFGNQQPCTGDFQRPPGTVWLVRAEGKDPLDKLVTTVLMKDHCECTAGWQLVPAKGLYGLSRIRYRRS
jgi:hypothetical protein